MGWSPAKRKGWRKLVPELSAIPNPPLARTVATLKNGARVADIGAGGRRVTANAICVDLFPMSETTVQADIHSLPFATGSLDCVICTGTLEHVRSPEAAIREIVRVLRPRGLVHIEVPFLQTFHADPHDYQRWTLNGLCRSMEAVGFVRREAGAHMGPGSALAVFLQDIAGLVAPRGKMRSGVRILSCYLLFWLKYLDPILLRKPEAHTVASGCYFVGTKGTDLLTP